MIGKRAQGPAVAGKALGGIANGAAGGAASSSLAGLKTVGKTASKTAITGASIVGAAGIMAGSQAANSLGQSKNALVSMAPSLFGFLLCLFAHLFAVGLIVSQNLSLSALLYLVAFILLVVAIVARPNNNDKFRDAIIIILSMMIMGMFK